MNLYIRYFDNETLVYTVDEALDFLSSLGEIVVDEKLEADVRDYVASANRYPKRYKVRPRVYFIIIKTEAQSMQDFKEKKAVQPTSGQVQDKNALGMPQIGVYAEHFGWYEGTLDFKRVVISPVTGKCEYRDTRFTVRCKANSGADCYERLVNHLRDRVDSRSQFPSVKGRNFRFKFLGCCK